MFRVAACLALMLFCSWGFAQNEIDDSPSFNRDIRAILAENCFACHGNDAHNRMADLRLDDRDAAIAAGAIQPGDPASSLLVERINSADPDMLMPPPDSHKQLTEDQRLLLKRWISAGAPYQPHWSFVPPQHVSIPVGSSSHPIDRFIEDKLKEIDLPTSPRAEPATLIRRLTLDLLGVPPTPEEVKQFVQKAQRSLGLAYRELVERLLADPRYGERWGRWWLDQARYADSNGYSIDAPREMWVYRDWVINSLNQDMPFDQFTIEQLAGDLLPNASRDQRIATGFHRNTQINQEGGIDPEQFRIDSIFDRVATTGTVWLGLTVGCAQCHDHKFDPISQEEYYRLFAFLNNQDEPTLKIYDEGLDVAALTAEFKQINEQIKSLPQGEKPADEISRRRDELDRFLNRVPTAMVLAERQQPRTTNIFIKGDFTRPSDQVTPGTPAVLHAFSPQQSSSKSLNRLDLAQWIVSPDNPLTARVIVNRVWQQYFGRGIVETENDFGSQGTLPTHPELLDWMALEFQERGWSLKSLHRLIVTSETYCQSSTVRERDLQRDPNNYFLARQSRLRLDAEIVRDVALSACGLLESRVGGPSVFPSIPAGVMNQGQVKRDWRVSGNGNQFRRGMYTFIYRGSPHPSLSVFDAPEGLTSCTRRIRSNTPLQSLTLMNDAGYVEFAHALEDIIRSAGIEHAFLRCVSRHPTADETAILRQLDPFTAARALLNLDETITRE